MAGIIQELEASSYGLSMMQTVASRATRQQLQVPPLCPPSVQHSEIGECARACRSRYCRFIHAEVAVTTSDDMELRNDWVINDEHYFARIIVKFFILSTVIYYTHYKIVIFTVTKYYVGGQIENN